MCDQLRADAIGAYGGTIVPTPNMDRLAREGARYTSAYTASPVCVPSRASLITGNEPQTNACYENEMPMPDTSTVMDLLTDAGYVTHGVGKMHFTPDGQELRGFVSRDTGEEFGTVDDDDYLAYLEEVGFGYVEHPHGLRDEMYYIPQLSPVPEEHHFSHWVADRSIAFIEERDDDAPFFLWSSFIAPHPPFAPPAPWHRRLAPSLLPEPFEPQGGEALMTVYNRLQERYKYRDGGRDRRLLQLIRAYYYASVAHVDAQIGRILTELDDRGLAESTLVILTADHGEFLGDYGTFGKRSFLDAAARVPLLVRGPGFVAGSVVQSPVSLIDVYPTIAAAAGKSAEREGLSLADPLNDRHVYGQYQAGVMGMYAVITPLWKYIWSAPDQREILIDRRSGKESMNLAYNVRTRATLEQLRAEACEHFADLADVDFDALSSNVTLRLGAPADARGLAALASLELDPDAATLVVRESWDGE
ncbi:hypothetical protein ASG83_04240 [Yonghaparkia sp. Soil809]|nr:hypothetical protein ASG83_04240 [Yonghaparkia sp. Soil809]